MRDYLVRRAALPGGKETENKFASYNPENSVVYNNVLLYKTL